MMVFDTVHSSSVGRIHAGHTRWMKIVRPPHSLEGSEAKRHILSSSTSTVEKKGATPVNPENRPSLVIRRRIMVPQLEEADDARFHQLTPALSSQAKSSTTSLNHCQEKKLVDHSTARSHVCGIFARSSASTQDQVCKSSAAPMTKTLHLFDLNELPTLPDSSSPIESPTSTIASADSTTHVTADAAATPATATDVTFFSNSSPSSVTTLTDVEGDPHRKGAKLAVDLGLLPPASRETPRQHNGEESSSMLPQCTEIPTPARKRLRKLSEYAGVHSSTTHDTFMAKPCTTTDGGDVCNHRDVPKTLAIPEPETKVRGKDVVDDEVLAAASVLLMLSSSSSSSPSSKKRRREFSSFPSIAEASSAFTDEDLGARDPGPSTSFASDLAASDTSSPRSLGSGGSVLSRPSNKQRYRSMAELMAQTPILRRV